MKKFVRKQIHQAFESVGVEKHFLRAAIVAGFVVLEAVDGQVIGESQHEIVMAIVASAKECASFGDELAEMRELFGGHGGSDGAVGDKVQAVFGLLSWREIVGFEKCSSEQGRIHKPRQGN